MKVILIAMMLAVNACPKTPLEKTLDALCMVESSGGQDTRDGDGERAIGHYQIWQSYWKDGTRILKADWPYADACDPRKARAVVRAYVTTYARVKGYPQTPETWARLHNGGPNGPNKKSTLVYWQKVRRHMK
jgi:hypothetical protein